MNITSLQFDGVFRCSITQNAELWENCRGSNQNPNDFQSHGHTMIMVISQLLNKTRLRLQKRQFAALYRSFLFRVFDLELLSALGCRNLLD